MADMIKIKLSIIGAVAVFFCVGFYGLADTFTNSRTNETLTGYATGEIEDGNAVVVTKEKGRTSINLAQWSFKKDGSGRNNIVAVFAIEGDILYEIETEAFEMALKEAVKKGPLFIIIEIDTPGGRIDLARRICAAINDADGCRTIAFVKSGEHGGAISAGAAVALACDKLYMAQNTVIGAATMITSNAQTMKKFFGEKVGEKLDSAWRAIMASLAERNGRPGIMARAMVDSDIEVIEVQNNGKRWFIDPINKKEGQKIVKTWSAKGQLLTLTADEAAACGIADEVVNSRNELLQMLEAQNTEVMVDKSVEDARYKLARAEGQLGRIRKSLDLKIKQMKGQTYYAEALKIVREARAEFKTLVNLAKEYPDLNLDVVELENELNSIEAAYRDMKKSSRRR